MANLHRRPGDGYSAKVLLRVAYSGTYTYVIYIYFIY